MADHVQTFIAANSDLKPGKLGLKYLNFDSLDEAGKFKQDQFKSRMVFVLCFHSSLKTLKISDSNY